VATSLSTSVGVRYVRSRPISAFDFRPGGFGDDTRLPAIVTVRKKLDLLNLPALAFLPTTAIQRAITVGNADRKRTVCHRLSRRRADWVYPTGERETLRSFLGSGFVRASVGVTSTTSGGARRSGSRERAPLESSFGCVRAGAPNSCGSFGLKPKLSSILVGGSNTQGATGATGLPQPLSSSAFAATVNRVNLFTRCL